VIVVFTQYDILAKEVRDDYAGRNLERIMNGEVSRDTQRFEIQQAIHQKFNEMNREWERIIPSIDVGTVYLSNPTDKLLRSNPGLRGSHIFLT
jgi:hypothetical protein